MQCIGGVPLLVAGSLVMFDRPDTGERAYLVHIENAETEEGDAQELRELLLSAGGEVVGEMTINLRHPSARMLINAGRVEEIAHAARALDAELVLFSAPLSPAQQRNLEAELERRVLTRTELILDIFAQRARSHEGMLQVELAQLRHWSTRLVRGWSHLDRQKGGIGLRGAGETQLELDQRIIGARIRTIEARLAKVRGRRAQSRKARTRRETQTVALVGYTNAGKSTLFNRLSGADVYAQDQLFATLDPTMRRIQLPSVGEVVLADTVGFVRHLPHQLVDAFKATHEEVAEAALILHVIDAASPARAAQQAGVMSVLADIEAVDQPIVEVFNKIDLLDEPARVTQTHLRRGVEDLSGRGQTGARDDDETATRVWVSAGSGAGIGLLQQAMADVLSDGLFPYELRLAPSAGRLRADLYQRQAVVAEAGEDDGGCRLQVMLSRDQVNRLVNHAEVASLRATLTAAP